MDDGGQRSRSVVVPFAHTGRPDPAQATIGVDYEGRRVDLIVEDGSGRKLMLSLGPAEAQMLGRRLTQAFQAIASAGDGPPPQLQAEWLRAGACRPC